MTDRPPEPSASASAAAPCCAIHEEALASGTCARCGNFVCPLCLDPSSDFAELCEACRERVGDEVVPWERAEGTWPARWARTVRDVLTRPTDTLVRTRPGSLGASLAFAAITGAGIGLSFAVLGGCAVAALLGSGGLADLGAAGRLSPDTAVQTGFLIAMLLLYPVLTAVGSLLLVAIRGVLFHLPVALTKGEGGLGASLWSCAYLSSIHLLWLPLVVVTNVPAIGPLIAMLGGLLIEVVVALNLTTFARAHHRLEGGRAVFAGWFPFLVLAGLFGSCCLLGGLLGTR